MIAPSAAARAPGTASPETPVGKRLGRAAAISIRHNRIEAGRTAPRLRLYGGATWPLPLPTRTGRFVRILETSDTNAKYWVQAPCGWAGVAAPRLSALLQGRA